MPFWKALGPGLAGCHEISEEVAREFNRLGGEDIQVWDTEYLIWSKAKIAVDYVAKELALTDVEEGVEEPV